MPHAKVTFQRLVQDSQDFGSDDEHMVSRIFFDLAIGDRELGGFYADVKQTVGASFEHGPLEISRPHGYDGPFAFDVFRDAAEKYYRDQVGAGGRGIRIAGGATNIRMRNNSFVDRRVLEFEIDDRGGPW
jgi:hypothetical protein